MAIGTCADYDFADSINRAESIKVRSESVEMPIRAISSFRKFAQLAAVQNRSTVFAPPLLNKISD